MTLAQKQIESKQNEIVAIPQVLELVDVKDKVVTIDAIACQHSIIEQIIDKQANYVIALKANGSGQPKRGVWPGKRPL